MNINIRKSVKENFKNNNEQEIEEAINSSITEQNEITLPGLGVFFELVWQQGDQTLKQSILKLLKQSLEA